MFLSPVSGGSGGSSQGFGDHRKGGVRDTKTRGDKTETCTYESNF